ncbi:MAG: hypothetical protein M0T75_07195, partial [Chloroflexi bacterium]|nr:hypothetical protein [Chloroflexota bacterium]
MATSSSPVAAAMSPWDQLLQALGALLSPDWNALVLLVPLGLALVVLAYLGWVVRRYATAGPTTARMRPPLPAPPGIHMPGPSLAPFLAATGAFAFLLALLFVKVQPAIDPATKLPVPRSTTIVVEPFGIAAVVVGIVALVGALLYWGREAIRDYDALESPPALPAVASGVPPAGVHVPGPSFRPLLASIASGALLLGLVIDPVVFLAGVLMVVISLLGWLADARREYREVEKADATGHLAAIPAPRFPTGTLLLFAVLFGGSLLVAAGVIPPRNSTGGAGGAPSAAPSGSAAPATPAPASGAPSAAPSGSASGAPSAA